MPTVILMGLRGPAIEAAVRLGLDVVVVADRAPGPRLSALVADLVEVSFAAPAARWAELAGALRHHQPEAVLATVERSVGPAAHLRAALGLAGLSPEAARRCTHKGAMKTAIRAAGIACADFALAEAGLGRDALVERLGLPLVVKPCLGSGGRGTAVCRQLDEVPDGLEAGWMAEAFVAGVEMSAEGVGWGGRMEGMSATQYLVPREANVVPAALDAATVAAVRRVHGAAWAALGVERGMTHLEVFLGDAGPVFGELAVRPPGGHLMRLIGLAYGLDAWALWVRVERGEAVSFPERPERAAAAWILHPGAGVVTQADGLDAVREMPGVVEATLRARPGDRVETREGSGEEVGHIVVEGATAEEAQARLEAARAAIGLEVERSASEASRPGAGVASGDTSRPETG